MRTIQPGDMDRTAKDAVAKALKDAKGQQVGGGIPASPNAARPTPVTTPQEVSACPGAA